MQALLFDGEPTVSKPAFDCDADDQPDDPADE